MLYNAAIRMGRACKAFFILSPAVALRSGIGGVALLYIGA